MKERSERILARVAQRRYWGEVEGRLVVVAWRRSGESQARFAARHHIHLKRLGWWIARFKSGRSAGSNTVYFVGDENGADPNQINCQ